MRLGWRAPSVFHVRGRTPVFIYASDPMSAAGAKAQLVNQPAIELVGPADLGRARVALVVAEAADAVARIVRAIQRDGIPKVLLVAAHFDEAGVVATTAAGVTSFLRRVDATSARLTECIREADETGCCLPEGLLKKAAVVQARMDGQVRSDGQPLPVIDLRDRCQDGAVSTLTERKLGARETEVLRLVADGYDTTDIAEQLSYSESTIKGVLAKIMNRLEARNRCHAVAIVVREGLI
jgi:DNA-binding NarL/FixJ family response regulator